MNTRTSASNLGQAMKDLSIAWQKARAEWRDPKSLQFDHDYLEALPGQIARATLAIEELDAILRKVKKDCE